MGRPRAAIPERLASAWDAAKSTAKPEAKDNELLLYDWIGIDPWTGEGVSAAQVVDWLGKLPAEASEIVVRINSPGGEIFEGVAIYNQLINSGRRVVVRIDSIAASISSVIAMAGDRISMAGNAQMMIHKGWSLVLGNADDFRKEAETLDSIDSGSIASTYAARTGQTPEAITQMMADETWLSAEAAKEKGFVDEIEALKTAPKDKKAALIAAEEEAAALKAKAEAEANAARTNTLRQKAQLRSRQAALAAA